MKLAFLGLGVMGYPMAGHLQKAGNDVTVYNRNGEKAKQWAADFSKYLEDLKPRPALSQHALASIGCSPRFAPIFDFSSFTAAFELILHGISTAERREDGKATAPDPARGPGRFRALPASPGRPSRRRGRNLCAAWRKSVRIGRLSSTLRGSTRTIPA